MWSRSIMTIGLAIYLCGLGAMSLSHKAAAQPEVEVYQGIRYLSGGFSEEERAALSNMGREYSLKLVFANLRGELLADVKVIVEDQTGNKILEAVSDGPWLYAELPKGAYHVMAEVDGHVHRQEVQVEQQEQSQLQFSWDVS